MAIEYQAHIHNNTGKLTPAPTNRPIIRCKWVFKLKRKLDDSIDRYKAQLVAEGFHQTQGLDYFDTFRPMVKVATIRIVLTVALSFRWTIRQLDVQNSFLNSDLRERVFLQHPPSNDLSQVLAFLKYLQDTFALRDLGCINYFLGIEVSHVNGVVHLNQQKYIQDLLTRSAIQDSKSISTPGAVGTNLSQLASDTFSDASLYHSIVGALQ
ncbi:Retrovirus-related Pol polyprotein from transposon RE1 [Vitis vinifera]|uniref:Retrovirus-related Pol polyprotein from transposon RE1 n=1 Tax=Vitis vinifera TaxID=29760 RepID=A0A438IX55_VITVI|nr:Retrovirus-related Pol polyprotein from transposon RE1 [Vitis vinifera]